MNRPRESPLHGWGEGYILNDRYPLSVNGIRREYPDQTVQDAEAVLYAGLDVALDAVSAGPSTSKAVLALGPYGATTKPGAEYSGLYAPPFGFGTVLDSESTTYAEPESSQKAEDALYKFHLSRIQSYAKSDRWNSVEWVGFETIPLVREIRAIRRALSDLSMDGQKTWVACTFPDGQSPEFTAGGGKVSVADTVRSLLADGEGKPDGIGINCTNPAYIPALVDTFNTTLASLRLDRKPWFVLYPDGGQVYEPISRSWSKEKLTAEEWAERMMEVIEKVDKSGLWAGVIAGGCCKTSADEIRELRRRVDRYLG